jgi:hypothetical protein
MLLDVLIDSVKDVLKMIPPMFIILFLTDLLMLKLKEIKIKNTPLSVAIASLFGLIPQCGVPVGFAQVYANGSIRLCTLFAVFLASSDEALIIAIANYEFTFILKLVIAKISIATIAGLCLFLINTKGAKLAQAAPAHLDLSREMKGGAGANRKFTALNLLMKTLKSTVLITLWVFLVVFILNLILEGIGPDVIEHFISGRWLLIQPLIAVLIGFIPSCASSVFITEAYMNGFFSFGALIAGLCANTGFGILVIFRACPIKQALKVLGLLLGISVLAGELLFFIP